MFFTIIVRAFSVPCLRRNNLSQNVRQFYKCLTKLMNDKDDSVRNSQTEISPKFDKACRCGF